MKKNLNIIIIGLIINDIKKTVKSINQLIKNNKIKIIVVAPKNIKIKIQKQIKNNEIFFTHDNKEGIYQAMNKGLSLSKSKNAFNWFLNSGDFAEIKNLKNLLNFNNKNDLLSKDVVFFINTKKYNLVSFLYKIMTFLGFKDINIIKFFLLISVFPTSHQNIIIKNHLHDKFDVNYKYSSDFNLLIKILSRKNIRVLIRSGFIARNSKGGITDLNRFKTIKERRDIIKKNFRRLDYTIIYETCYLIRVILMLIKKCIKIIIRILKEKMQIFNNNNHNNVKIDL